MKKVFLFVLAAAIAFGVYTLVADNGADSSESATSTPDQGTSTGYFYDHSDELRGQTVDYYPDNEAISGYLSVPEGASSTDQAPAIILIHEWWGLNDDIRQMADDYASEGYVALAVDMYGAEATASSSVAGQRAGEVRENMEEAMANLSAAVSYLESRDDVDSNRIASVGWCFGGGWAYQMAVNEIGVEASVMYYGQFDAEDDYNNMRASILGHFGEEDTVIDIDNAREFKARLENADQSSAVYIYPNVGHSFANYDGGDNIDYSPEAAQTAWERTLEFLDDELVPTATGTEDLQVN